MVVGSKPVVVDAKAHWESVYRTKQPDQVSWFQQEPTLSLDMISRAKSDARARIIDVGGGASSMVDALLRKGYSDITVLDISAAALAHARERLGVGGASVRWLAADVLTARLDDAAFEVWHDRAVFHFLTSAADRDGYVKQLRAALRPGGHAVIATFAEDGPARCSGLEVARYSPEALHGALGADFEPIANAREQHVTPAGASQSFVYGLFRYNP